MFFFCYGFVCETNECKQITKFAFTKGSIDAAPIPYNLAFDKNTAIQGHGAQMSEALPFGGLSIGSLRATKSFSKSFALNGHNSANVSLSTRGGQGVDGFIEPL